LPRTHDHPDAYLDRAVLGIDQSFAVKPGEPGRPLKAALQLAAYGPHRRACRQQLLVVGSIGTGLVFHITVDGRRVHVAAAEDDDLPKPGSQAAADPADDAVDDAADVYILFILIPKWIGVVLGYLKPDGCRYSVFYYRFRGAFAGASRRSRSSCFRSR